MKTRFPGRQDEPRRLGGRDVHLRLRAASLVRRSTVQDIVAGLIEREVAGVRLPSIGGHNEEPATGRTDGDG